MKERLVEDWLNRINERGYQAAFGQILAGKGYKVLRIGHSPYEHGKDVLAISPNGEIHCFQLKDGDISLKTFENNYAQLIALVQTRPSHPSLPSDYVYRPFFVTNGLFKDPALDRIKRHNIEWQRNGFPEMGTIDGRWLHQEFTKLSTDFWPTSPPDIRALRSLYLVDGRGDFDVATFVRFVRGQFPDDVSQTNLERIAAAANIFTSYILGEFYRQSDHWSIFRGWTITAACISGASERINCQSEFVKSSFELACGAAKEALAALSAECQTKDAFKPKRLELDDYTRLRNTVTVGAWAVWCLMNPDRHEDGEACVSTIKTFINADRLVFWSEGSFAFICSLVWILERHNCIQEAKKLLFTWLSVVISRQHDRSKDPLPDAYASPEDVLKDIVEMMLNPEPRRVKSAQSSCLYSLLMLLVRRGYRKELEETWRQISHVTVTVFQPEEAAGYLEWNCQRGTERDFTFLQPQSWGELVKMADSPPIEKLPHSLRSDNCFRLMFLLSFPHRLAWSIIGSLDNEFRRD